MTGTAGQLRVPKFFMLQAVVPVATLSQQQHIVTRIDALLAQADAIELAAEVARQGLDRLGQSILARAFRGELVSQDRNDEPALALLGRIRAGRAQQTGQRSSRRHRLISAGLLPAHMRSINDYFRFPRNIW